MRPLAAAMAAILSLALTASGACVPPSGHAASEIDAPEAYAVYAALLPNEWPVEVAGAKTLVIQKETATNWGCMPTGGALEFAWRPVVENFRAENSTVRNLVPGHDLGRPYVVVSSAAIKSIFEQRGNAPTFGWPTFYQRYPDSGGYMVFSAVGFDRPKRRAMVYIALWCGSLCGEGQHHFVEKIKDVWREVTIPGVMQRRWVS